MKACTLCGCTEERGCQREDGSRCTWFDPMAPVCSACAAVGELFLVAIGREPRSVAACLDLLKPWRRDVGALVLAWVLDLGAIEARDDLLYLAPPPDLPAMQHIGKVDGYDVWSPGTFEEGKGWGPVRSDLAAAVTEGASPIVIPFWPEPKEP